MIILSVDIGGKTRNGFAVIDSESMKLLHYEYIPYDSNNTPQHHRFKIIKAIESIHFMYNIDLMVFEKINLFVGSHVSKLNNILTLCRVQTTICDIFSESFNIYAIPVQSWKKASLGNAKADKDDSIKAVKMLYPQVNLEIKNYKPRKKTTEIIMNHDLADAIMIGVAVCKNPNLTDAKYIMNYK